MRSTPALCPDGRITRIDRNLAAVLRSSGIVCCEILEASCGGEQLLAGDVGVPADRREVGVAEVLGDQACVAEFLAEPGRGGVAERVRGDMLLESGPFRCTADDLGEDRLLEASSMQSAEDGRLGAPLPLGSK